MSDALLTRHRPREFDEVYGHEAEVRALKRALDDRTSHAFLFTGPPGTGKTTLARLSASTVGCSPATLQEIDGATFSGADDMRSVTANLPYKPMQGESRGILVDEVQALSKQAFQALLKSIEEPPSWVYWFLCTTEPTKVPAAIVSRCIKIELKPVPKKVLEELLLDVCEVDAIEPKEGVVRACAEAAEGSFRQALANLGLCSGAKSEAEARRLLSSVHKAGEAVELARLLVKGASWKDIVQALDSLKGANPESVRHTVRAYMTKVALGARNSSQLENAMAVLEEFSEPWPPSEGNSPLVLACGRLVL